MRRLLLPALLVCVVVAVAVALAVSRRSSTPSGVSQPGASASGTPGTLGFSTAFQRTALAQLEGKTASFRSTDPYTQQQFDQGELLVVQGVSPSAKVPFFSHAFLGHLEYEPFAASGLAHTVKRTAGFVKNYCLPTKGAGRCAQVGRATGVIALLTPDSVRSESRGFKRAGDKDYRRAYGGRVAIRPPGYLSGKGVTQAGHLLGYELGGPVRNPRNFVTQWNLANAPAQSSLEDAIRTELSRAGAGASSLTVFVRVTPRYQGTCVVPYEVDYQAVGSDGWQLPTATKGIAAQWLSFTRGTDGVTLAHIRNAERSGNTWLVPGQDPQAECVPSGYAG
jgi:hypothetical protein